MQKKRYKNLLGKIHNFIYLNLLIFIFFVCSSFAKVEPYKILKIVDCNSFYIDLNNNRKLDINELYHIKGIVKHSALLNKDAKKQAENITL